MPLRIPATVTGLEASIQAQAKKAGRNLKINLGGGAKSVEGLSQPLGRITGKADQFTKSMEAANARVLAFGASVGVLSAVSQGFKELITTTIQVEKSLASINTILGASGAQLDKFKKTIFEVARGTEQSFDTVATAALELSRQGLKAEVVVDRLNDSLILSRLSGLGATEAVAGLTAAINSFNHSGVTSSEVLNKLSAASIKAAVSERDLIEGIKRSGSVAQVAGVSLDELVGVISAVQEKTARGGAVIGNSFKTIFTRIQSLDKLQTMQNLGVQVTDASGDVLSATKLIQNLGKTIESLPEAKKLQIAENLVGKFQIAPFLAILDDYNSKTSTAIEITGVSQNATREAYERNVALNKTLSAAINEATVNLKELANTLGEIGITDSLQNILGFFNTLVSNIKGLLEGEGLGSDFAKGIIKGLGAVLSGPGLAIFGAIIAKLTIDLVRFGAGSLKTFFGLNRAAKAQAALQGQIASTLLNNKQVQQTILTIEQSTLSVEEKRRQQIQFFTTALNEQMGIMTQMQGIATRIAPAVMRGTARGGRGAGGFIPNFDATRGYGSEAEDIRRGVGGAPSSARAVNIPNFNFGGGQRGTMTANTSEFIVPNFAGGSGSAIFNQNMVSSMGLPTGARKVRGSRGYIPNFVDTGIYGTKHTVATLGPLNLTQEGSDGREVMSDSKLRSASNSTTKPERAAAAKALLKAKESLVLPLRTYNAKGTEYGMIVNDPIENRNETLFVGRTKKGITATKTKPKNPEAKVVVPIFGVDPKVVKGKTNKKLVEELTELLLKEALDFAYFAGSGALPREEKLTAEDIDNTLNEGSARSAAGSVFESGLASLLQAKDFEDFQKRSPTALMDFTGDAIKNLKRGPLFKIGKSKATKGLEAKGSAEDTLIASTGQKIYKIMAKGKEPFAEKAKAAYGYIPSFAGALEDAITREQAAGIPTNQIRINQGSQLRGAQNPMGLAVTNTRDEPTGAIPSFARRSEKEGFGKDPIRGLSAVNRQSTFVDTFSESLEKGTKSVEDNTKGRKKEGKASRDMLGTVFAVQAGLSFLTGTTSEASEGIGRFANRVTGALSGATTAVFAGTAVKDFGESLQDAAGDTTAFGKVLGKVGQIGMVIGVATAAFAGIKKVVEDATGITDANSRSMEILSKAAEGAARSLESLTAAEKRRLEGMVDELVPGASTGLINAFGMLPSFEQWQTGITRSMPEVFQGESLQHRKEQKGGRFFGGEGESFDKAFPTLEFSNDETRERVRAAIEFGRMQGISRKVIEQEIKFAGLRQEFVPFRTDEKTPQTFAPESVRQFLPPGIDPSEGARLMAPESRFGRKQKPTFEITAQEAESLALRMAKAASLAKELREEIARMPPIENFPVDFPEQMAAVTDSVEKRMGLEGRIDKTIVRQLLNERYLKDFVEGKADAAKAVEEATRRASNFAKQEISTQISLLKMKDKEVVAAKRALSDLKDKGNATREQLNEADLALNVAKADKKVRDSALTEMNALVTASKSLTFSTEEAAQFQKDLVEAMKDGKLEEDEVNDLRKKAKKLQDDITGELKLTNKEIADGRDLRDQAATKQRSEYEVDKLRTLEIRTQNALLQDRVTFVAGLAADTELTARLEKKSAIETKRADLARLQLRRDLTGDEERGRQQRAAQISRDIVELENQQGTADRGVNQRNRAAALLGVIDPERFAEIRGRTKDFLDKKKGFTAREEFTDLEGDELQTKMKKLLVALEGKAGVSQEVMTKLGVMIGDFRREEIEGLAAAGDRLKEAERGVLGAGLPDIQSLRTLMIKEAERLRDTQAQRDFTRLTTINPADRLKQTMAEDRVGEKIAALRAQDTDAFRLILEEEQFAATLVDASYEFAQNIGAAMVDAIARGENLKDILLSAATDFFNKLSSAFMSRAVDQIIGKGVGGGGGGGGGGFLSLIGGLFGKNSGGLIRGGSGNRDDVPTLLTGGEFVMRRGAVQRYGTGFLENLNAGGVGQMQRGGLFTPGTHGQGAIRGVEDLLNFGSQSFTTGRHDITRGGEGFAELALEPHSGALTRWGTANSPAAQRERESQLAALGLAFDQMTSDDRRREEAKQKKKSLIASILGLVASVGISGLAGGFGGGGGRGGGLSSLFTSRGGGGSIPYAAGVDTVPAMLSGGEFVMNAAATQNIGRGNLSALNSGAGGDNGSGEIVGRLDELIDVSERGNGETVINITVNSDGTTTQDGDGTEGQQNMAIRLRDVVRQVIADEQRLGGSLRAV